MSAPVPPAGESVEAPATFVEAPPAEPYYAAPLAYDIASWWSAEGIVLLDVQTWDAASLDAVNAALNALPAHVRSRLANRALGPLFITVSTTGRSPSGQQPYGGIANYFSTNNGLNELVVAPGQGVFTILHELGHAYNLRNVAAASYAQVFLDAEMQGFVAASGWQVLTPPDALPYLHDQSEVAYTYWGATIWKRVSRDDPVEDFANSFALYYADPAALQWASPERYAWFDANVGR